MDKITIAYRLYEDKDEYGCDDEITLACLWDVKDAEAFKNEHNRYANERETWVKKSFDHAHTNPELKEKRRECQEIKKKLDIMNKRDSEYQALENRWYELLRLVSDMFDNLSNMWKASNPFITTALPQNGKCFIETLTIK